MSRLVFSRSRFGPRSTTACILFAFAMVLSAPNCSRANEFGRSPARVEAAESGTFGRLLSNLSRPTIRVFVDGDHDLPIDAAGLKAIDLDDQPESRSTEVEDGTETGNSFSRLFDRPQGTEWLYRDRLGDRDAHLYSLRENSSLVIQPIRRISIPNPLRLIGNPLKWGGRFRGEFGTNFDDIDLIRGNLIVNSGLPIGFDTEVNYRHDKVAAHKLNNFWTGDFNMVYRFGKIRYAEIRAGIGINWLSGDGTTDFGFNSTYGVDFYLRKPWVISTSFDWGTLNSDSLLHMRVTAGWDFGRFELFTGYDFYEVGSRERKALVAGIGMWF